MRKFTILMALIAFASFAMAQALSVPSSSFPAKANTDKNIEIKKVDKTLRQTKDVAWYEDFEGNVNWSVAANPNTDLYTWHVFNNAEFEDFCIGADYTWTINDLFYDAGDDSNHYAVIDIISGLPLLGGPGQPDILESYIQFDDIYLADVSRPSLSWLQVFRALNTNNYATLAVDVSNNGGTTWTEYRVNYPVEGNTYGDNEYSLYIGDVAGNQDDVSIRFRWSHNKGSQPTVQLGYSWLIDDILIFDTPDYDAELYNAAMNFFVYIDYQDEPDGYHYSSHFGQIPIDQIDSENAFMAWNAIVVNRGFEQIKPAINVSITNSYGVEVYNEDYLHEKFIPAGATDTVDCIDPFFFFENPMLADVGGYDVKLTTSIQGQEDENSENNEYLTKFYVTNDVYARDLDNFTGRLTMNNWVAGGQDEEMIGNVYWLNEPTEVKSVDVFFHEATTPGNAFMVHLLYPIGEGEWESFAQSDLIMFDDDNIGTWLNVEFMDDASIDFDPNDPVDAPFLVAAAVQLFYFDDSEDSDIYILTDKTANNSDWGTFVKILSGGEWIQGIGWTSAALAIRLNLPERFEIASVEEVEVCDNELPYTWGTEEYVVAGTYLQDFGDEGIHQLDLIVHPTYLYESVVELCDNELPYVWQGEEYETSGTYEKEYITIHGCDSIYTLELNIHPTYLNPDDGETIHEMCDGDAFTWHGEDYTETGEYEKVYQTEYGCDSIYTLNLTVHPTYYFEETVDLMDDEFDGTYTWEEVNGEDYTETGVYTAEYQTEHGCDSIYTLNLNILVEVEEESICDSELPYTWGAEDYEEAGEYYQEFDDGLYKLILTVNPTYLFEEEFVICDNELPFVWQGEEYEESGDYEKEYLTVHGCDSIYTLSLTIHPTELIENTHEMCEGETYEWNGQTYTEAGNYTFETETEFGCESIHTLELTVNPAEKIEQNAEICDGDTYTWFEQELTEEDVYTYLHPTETSENGCAVIYELTLTVNPLPEDVTIVLDPENKKLYPGEFGKATIEDSQNDVVYWVTSGGNIVVEEMNGNGADLVLGDEFVIGIYEVMSKTADGCEKSQGTFEFEDKTGIDSQIALVDFTVYPNPAQDIIKIESKSYKSVLKIYSIDGKLVSNKIISNNAEINVAGFASGIYTVVLTDENGNVGKQRFVKE